MSNTPKSLKDHAELAVQKAYAPYSKFSVGAAILLESGEIYTGCNVENISSGLTVCAERNAVGKAVSDLGGGIRIKEVFVTNINEHGKTIHCSPCGACRQVLAEFSTPETKVSYHGEGDITTTTMKNLLPDGFDHY
ncbi:cytidine deaminase [Sneathiella limimaris]|uniref:cytidine deaminase n=1 Tax=Sneathiella limimaris TaxID=1964213 RepID=UPI00146E0624|nr:cytidine deaminase [Sneathiella limimaris]